ncbi:MAG: hypothetical protein BWY32_02682 [bacterium ADurb.Bin243]|nr:MAG: hypothetical protein BWY32_02682 [bacterium ADurb.Bin243]
MIEKLCVKNFTLFKKRRRSSGGEAFTLIEIICVIMILSAVVSISYPSMTAYYHRQQLSSCALEINSELSAARSLSIGRVDNMTYGVIFERNSEYRTMAFKSGVKITGENYSKSEISKIYGEKRTLKPGVKINNFDREVKEDFFLIIFRGDGVATADAVNFPLPDNISRIVLTSGNAPGEFKIAISKTTGISMIE